MRAFTSAASDSGRLHGLVLHRFPPPAHPRIPAPRQRALENAPSDGALGARTSRPIHYYNYYYSRCEVAGRPPQQTSLPAAEQVELRSYSLMSVFG